MKTVFLTLACLAVYIWADPVTVDSLTVDSVWNSDSASRISRDCLISYKLDRSELAWCVISLSLDSGVTWTPVNPLQVLDSAVAQGPAVSGWRQTKVRVLGPDRPAVAFRVTANQIKMVDIPGGSFQMGSAAIAIATPVHTVTLTPFKMSSTIITRELFNVVAKWNACSPLVLNDSTHLLPIFPMNWRDAVLFCNAMSKACGFDSVYSYAGATFNTCGPHCLSLDSLKYDMAKNGYRLPTEAEFEYAERAGTTTDFYWGKSYPVTTHDDSLQLDSNAVWGGNSGNHPWPVGSKKPNGWGLYDMAGNMWQWCQDWGSPYTAAPQIDPVGPDTFTVWAGYSGRCARAGSCNYGDYNCRSAQRFSILEDHLAWNVSFRVVRR